MGNEAQKQTQWEPVCNGNEVQHSTKHKTTRTSTGTLMETKLIDLDIIGDDVVNNKN